MAKELKLDYAWSRISSGKVKNPESITESIFSKIRERRPRKK